MKRTLGATARVTGDVDRRLVRWPDIYEHRYCSKRYLADETVALSCTSYPHFPIRAPALPPGMLTTAGVGEVAVGSSGSSWSCPAPAMGLAPPSNGVVTLCPS